MTYIIALCLIYMVAIIVGIIVRLSIAPRKERLQYVKNFKRGKFTLIYIAFFPLYFLAYRYSGMSLDTSIWQSINSCIDTVFLKYHFSDTAALMGANLFYKITLEIGFALVTLNAVMFSISFVGQILLNLISSFITCKFRKKVVVVVGYNPNSLDIVKSVKKQHGKAVLMGKMSSGLRDDAFLAHADCIHLSPDENLGEKIRKLFKNFGKKKVSIILNCEDDATSLRYVKQLCQMIEDKKLTELPLTRPYGLQVYVFASKTNESAFLHYEEASYGLIKFINRHEQIAMDFIENHPLTEFMTDEQLDYTTATIKSNINLNVIMIGFGSLNETLFLTSVSNNQFLTIKDGKLQPKAVNYHLYDRNYPAGKITKENSSVHSRSMHHGYMRYSKFLKECSSEKEKYLELIEEPATIRFHPCDISHPDFYSSVQAILSDENAYTYVVVSFGADMENIELAEKLQQKFHEWNLPSLVKIFVKVRDEKLVNEIREDFTNDLVQIFGTNRNSVYNANRILSEETATMARLRHLFYTAESLQKENKQPSDEELERLAREKWYYKYKQFQRESNVFACLSIRMKLQLLGYDYAEDGEDCANEFETKYEENNARSLSSTRNVKGKKVWNYSNAEQNQKSIRWTYAVQEHQRWCANMICNGVIPSDKEEIIQSGGKVLDKRLHGNLTTMDGLVEYRKLIANAMGISEEESDVIRYDYQLMDDVVWLLHECGYKLIKKK